MSEDSEKCHRFPKNKCLAFVSQKTEEKYIRKYKSRKAANAHWIKLDCLAYFAALFSVGY